MGNTLGRSSFDELVAGISADERRILLDKLKLHGQPETVLPAVDSHENDGLTVKLKQRIESESLLYKIILWIRSFFSKLSVEDEYNKDLVAGIARMVNRNHPGLIDYSHDLLCSLFFEKMKEMKTCADFFEPYMATVYDNLDEFYVFLGTFITPDISSQVKDASDPYQLPFDREVTGELRTSLIRKMDESLQSLPANVKGTLYTGVKSVEWLHQFSELPYTHFLAQFTAIVTDSYTCPFKNAEADFPVFERVIANTVPVTNEVLESIYLFYCKKNLHPIDSGSDTEKSVNEFIITSAGKFSMIRMFATTVPLALLGKVIFNEYDWQGDEFGGAEDWFSKYRRQWKRIFDDRWESWLRDRKKSQLSTVLKSQFQLDEFPEMLDRPWASLWGGMPFNGELVGGFLEWFNRTQMQSTIAPLSTLVLEGVFINTENRKQLADAIEDLSEVSQRLNIFADSFESHGSYGAVFDKLQSEHIRTLKEQAHIDSILLTAETEIHEIDLKFCKACKDIDQVLAGIFDDIKKVGYESIQNLTTIRGHENREFRDTVMKSRDMLNDAFRIMTEIEPLDLPPANMPIK